jgi:hypothetical protein
MAQAFTFRAFGAENPEFLNGLGGGWATVGLGTEPTRYREVVLISRHCGESCHTLVGSLRESMIRSTL